MSKANHAIAVHTRSRRQLRPRGCFILLLLATGLLILIWAVFPQLLPRFLNWGRYEPQVIIYCTHASEEYLGQSRSTGQAGGVVSVGQSLADDLERLGIDAVFADTLHDYPSYDDAYQRSRETITQLAAQYPEVEVYIDLHRDSVIPGLNNTVNSNGVDYATMVLVVGTDQEAAHPNWEQNYSFALQVTATANTLVEGIMREPLTYSWHYNQDIAPKAILVELGNTANSEQEAKNSAAVLAQTIATILKQENDDK